MPPPSVPLDAIRQPAALYDTGGRIVAVNDLAAALAGRPLAGLTADELAGLFDARSPDGVPLADAGPTLARALGGEVVVDLPCTVTLADGRRHEIQATASPVREGDAIAGALVLWQDVTARVKAEDAVRALFTASPDVVLLLDADGTVLALNETTASAFGGSAAGLVGTSIWDVMHPDVVSFRRERFIEALRTGRPQRFEEVGNGRWFDSIVEPILSGAGEVTRVAIISRDITDRKRAEKALLESEAELRSILDRSIDALYRKDPATGRAEYYSPAIEAISGFSVEECLAMSVDDILARVHPDDRSSVISAKVEARAGRNEGTLEYRFLCRDGAYRWLLDRFRIERDADGRPVSWEGTVRDITEQKQTEEALEKSEEKYRALIETNADFVWEMDVQGRYTYCSPQMERLWGIRPEEMIGRTPFELMPHREAEHAFAAFAEMASTPRGFSGLETISYDGQGRQVTLEISGAPFFSDDGVLLGYRGVTRDVTERKQAGEALRQSEERLRLAQEGAGIAIWDRDAATDRVIVAPGFMRRYGLEPEAMATYADWVQYIHPDDRELVEAGRRSAFAAGEPLDIEFRIVIPSGEVRWIQLKGRGMVNGQGTLDRVVGVIIDVTDRKRAEEALRASEERYRELVEQAGSIILRYDLAGRITFVNEFTQRFFGYGGDELLGQNAVGTIIPETESSTGRDMAEMVRNIVRSPEHYAENENENVRKSGERVWVRWTNRPIVHPDGTVREFLAIGTDITDRKRAEEALAESEADARAFFENMVDPCAICEMVVDERGEPADIRLVEVNPAFVRTLGLPAPLIVGQTAFMILPTLHREWLDLFLEVSREGGFVEVEEPFPALDRRFHVTGFPVRNGRVAVVFRDITAG